MNTWKPAPFRISLTRLTREPRRSSIAALILAIAPWFVAGSCCSLASCSLASCVAHSEEGQASGTRRNVVLITFDDLRQDTPGFNGGPAKTPQMDRLAASSTNFRYAMATVGLCSPSRASLYTGRYGHQTGVDDNCYTWHSRVRGLADGETTLIEWSAQAGYYVGYFGKWHLGPEGPHSRGVNRPSTTLGRHIGERGTYRKPTGFTKIKRYYEPGKTFDQKPEYYGTRPGEYKETPVWKHGQQAARFLEEAATGDRPFALFVNFSAPHPPYVVPAPFDSMYSPKQVSLPDNFLHRSDNKPRYQNDSLWYWHDVGHLTELDWRKMNSHYWGFVSMADQAIGQLLDKLDALQLADDTMVVMVGDQGSMLGEHALYDKGPYCYDELMRIPLLIRLPGASSATIDRHVSIIDLNQTVVDWLGLSPGKQKRFSSSLLPLVREEADAWTEISDEAFYRYEWYNGSWYGIRAIRTPQWKYCWNPVGIDELYDLKNDPVEKVNRIDDPKIDDQLKHLQGRLMIHLKTTGDPAIDRFQDDLKRENPSK